MATYSQEQVPPEAGVAEDGSEHGHRCLNPFRSSTRIPTLPATPHPMITTVFRCADAVALHTATYLHGLRSIREYDRRLLRSFAAAMAWMPPPNGRPSFDLRGEPIALPRSRTAGENLSRTTRPFTSAPNGMSSRSRLRKLRPPTNSIQRPLDGMEKITTSRSSAKVFREAIQASRPPSRLVSASARHHRVQRNRHGESRNFTIPSLSHRDGHPIFARLRLFRGDDRGEIFMTRDDITKIQEQRQTGR